MAFLPVSPSNSNSSNLGQINDMIRQLNKEQTTKVFKQPGGNAIIQGKLPYEGGYGSLYYNSSNTPVGIISGNLPDGTTGMVWSKDGTDVLTLFS